MPAEAKAAFQFATMPQARIGRVFRQAVGLAGHLEKAVAQDPGRLIPLEGSAGDVAQAVGRIIPASLPTKAQLRNCLVGSPRRRCCQIYQGR